MSFRPAGEPFRPERHEVVLLSESDAKAFCVANHYAGSMPPARLRVGLMRKMPFEAEALVGAAIFSVPMQSAALSKYLKADMETGVELGRFVCTDVVEGNGESYFIAAANRMLQRETKIRAVVSYCDPLPRMDAQGNVVKPGHVGSIYMASSASLLGRSSPRTLILSRTGQVISERSLSKIRNDESGSAYAYRQLLAAGAPERQWGEDPAAYVRRALASEAFTRLRHPGNWVYAWGCGNKLERRLVRARIGPGLPYPKRHHPMAVA
ncbi:Mom family adenine methylcarbamoylation protein [Noviherbaspirillum pedocola]|uniref:Uncharacterized protein n=1 Tax=Noviherbaspirillum pedocola TaxID=2801341 RepID=A0A934SZJ7_9BURK|nr:hypothetical protein [Noviherbaspirillum pedocola]MBK4737901.1 hypothetical protein [Noviherbaspirillum pedocola]